MSGDDLEKMTKQIDSLLVSAASVHELYRKLDTLQRQGRGGWMTRRCPVWIGSMLVAVMIRQSKERAIQVSPPTQLKNKYQLALDVA